MGKDDSENLKIVLVAVPPPRSPHAMVRVVVKASCREGSSHESSPVGIFVAVRGADQFRALRVLLLVYLRSKHELLDFGWRKGSGAEECQADLEICIFVC